MTSQTPTSNWGIVRRLVSSGTIETAGTFLKDRMMQALTQLGVACEGRAPLEIGLEVNRILEDPDALRSLSDKQVAVLRGQFPLEDRLSAPVMAVAKEVVESRLLESIIGPAELVRMHMPLMARFVLPGNGGAGVPAHTDSQYNNHMSDFVTVWIPLVPVDGDCGGVRIFEGARADQTMLSDPALNAAFTSGATRDWHSGLDTSGLARFECIPMEPADALYFRPLVVHESMANRSARIRFSLDMRFLLSGATTTKTTFDFASGRTINPVEEEENAHGN